MLLGALLFGCTIGYTGNTEKAFKINREMTDYQFQWFASVMNIGAMAGSLIAGSLANNYGRKNCLLSSALVFTSGYLILALAPHQNFLCLFTGRVLTGIGAGISSFGVPLYIAEVAKTNRRGALGAGNQLGITTGIFVAYLIGNIETKSLYDDQTVCDWRYVTCILLGISVLFAALLMLIPETPRYLFLNSDTQAGEEALLQLRGDNFVSERQELLTINDRDQDQGEQPSLWMYKKQVFIGCMLQVFQQFSGVNNLIFYLTKILDQAQVNDPQVYSVYIMLLNVVVTIVAIRLMDTAGKHHQK